MERKILLISITRWSYTLKVMDEKPKNHQTTVILNKKHVIPYE